jgi:hypothetical protein
LQGVSRATTATGSALSSTGDINSTSGVGL